MQRGKNFPLPRKYGVLRRTHLAYAIDLNRFISFSLSSDGDIKPQ